MGFIFRAVAVLILFAFVVYVLKAIARLTHHVRATVKDVAKLRNEAVGRVPVNAEMIRCANCGAFVSSRDALTISARNSTQIFCSQECIRAKVSS